MKNNLITTIFVWITFVLISSCSESKKIKLEYEQMLPVYNLNSIVEDYYIQNYKIPENVNELREFYKGFDIDSLFDFKLQPGAKIQYVPIFNKDSELNTYCIISSKKKYQNIRINDEKAFVENFITVCDYNKGKRGDLLLIENTKFLILSSRNQLSIKDMYRKAWDDKVFYNVKFQADSTSLEFLERLRFRYVNDSILINGSFLNDLVKKKLQEEILNGQTIKLQGFKTRILSPNKFELTDVVFERKADSLNLYYDEVGNINKYRHLRGCDGL